jgi:hypothetical protein
MKTYIATMKKILAATVLLISSIQNELENNKQKTTITKPNPILTTSI